MTKHKIYVASSWRNEFYPEVVGSLRKAGHEVYDFRNPPQGGHGFRWSEISADYEQWSPAEYREQMRHPLAVAQLRNDVEASSMPSVRRWRRCCRRWHEHDAVRLGMRTDDHDSGTKT